MAEEKFSEIGRMEAIASLYKDSPFAAFDGGGFEAGSHAHISTSSRMFLEGIDFDLVYFPLKHLGYKCVVAVTGDLYADLARPRSLNVRLGISAKLDFAKIKELWEGISTAAKEHAYSKVTLDLSPSFNGLAISLAATGETPAIIEKRRSPARSKDLLCVSGSLGAAYLGLKVLERERIAFEKDNRQPNLDKFRMIVGAYLKPEISPNLLEHMEDSGIVPSRGYLIDRGLSDAVKRVVRDTGLGAKVYADKIPFEGNSFALGKEIDVDPVSAAMNGGEDYKLLFIIPILSLEKFRRDFQTFDIIGHLAQEEVGAVLVAPDGVEFPLKAQGWNNINQ